MLESDKRPPSLARRENVIACFDLLFPPTPFWVLDVAMCALGTSNQISNISKKNATLT